MKYKNAIFLLFLLLSVSKSISQQTLQIPLNIQDAYDNETRSASGAPGKNYWQNTADYSLSINFNPSSREVNGIDSIQYFNNSPDTLTEIWFKLYPNFYKRNSPRLQNVDEADLSDGVQIKNIFINGKPNDSVPKIDGTNMIIQIVPLLPKQTIQFSINYSYILNIGSHIRTGMVDSSSAFIAYFFPRIAVYDDIDGWNENPYLGPQEFYNDFCNFKAAVTVPKNFVVWATGNLENCNKVFIPKICERLQQAEKNDEVTNVIDSSDISQNNVTTNNSNNTFIYKASNVTDFVFAVSDHYMWQSSSLIVDKATGRRTRVDAVFNPAHKDYLRVINFARETVKDMSYVLPAWPYPYPHETVFDGLDQMEYPMMVNDNPEEEKADEIELTDHEIFHTMFPFYMGINETKYGWMDEGWATLGEWLISPMIDTTIKDDYAIESYENSAGREIDLPITTLTTQMNGLEGDDGSAFNINSYPKPAFGYLYVKDMLGDSLFTKALHNYIEKWHGKHPMPYDFFNCMNVGSGKNLNWFWKRWFFDNGYPDLAISKVSNSGATYQVIITAKGTKPVPIDLTIYFSDKSTQKLHRDISCWQNGNTTVTLSFNTNKKVKNLELGSLYIPDVNKENNIYKMK